MGTTFTIMEQPPTGVEGDGGAQAAVFEWTSERSSSAPAGGARACPQEAMDVGGLMTMVRTKNPGAINPSFQILGPDYKAITFHGQFDDRYNGEGWAVNEMRRLEDMFRRGNMIRISVDAEGFLGIVGEWNFNYRRKWDIGYRFTVELHSRDDKRVDSGVPPPLADPSFILAKLDQQGLYLGNLHARRPELSMYTKIMRGINEGIGDVIAGIDSVANALDTKTGILSPLGDLKNIATQLDSIRGHCSKVLTKLVSLKSTVAMTCATGKDVVDFEAWSKMVGSQLRLMRQTSHQGAVACQQRASGGVSGIYKPRKGQSLYSVSRDVYGTPFGWKAIYFANHLSSTTFAGTETLVIPAKGAK
jgi:hypothetical protein